MSNEQWPMISDITRRTGRARSLLDAWGHATIFLPRVKDIAGRKAASMKQAGEYLRFLSTLHADGGARHDQW